MRVLTVLTDTGNTHRFPQYQDADLIDGTFFVKDRNGEKYWFAPGCWRMAEEGDSERA